LFGVLDHSLGEETAGEVQTEVFVFDRNVGDGVRYRDLRSMTGLGALASDVDVQDAGWFRGVQDPC
jgi:hypothetical protein